MIHFPLIRRAAAPAAATRESGMTLLEIMIVLALIALITSTLGVAIVHRYRDGQLRAAQLQVRQIASGVQQFLVTTNQCPSVDDLVARRLVTAAPRDPWGQAISIRCPGQHDPDGADIVSHGPDQKEGTDDDIRSWNQ